MQHSSEFSFVKESTFLETMNYSLCFLLTCLVAASGYVFRTADQPRENYDLLQQQVPKSPLVSADPNQGKLSLPRLLVTPTIGSRYTNPVNLRTTLHQQKRIMQLLVDLSEPSTIPDIAETAKDFSIVTNLEKYTDAEDVEDYWLLQQEGLIFRNKKFSIFNERHKKEAISLFKVLLGAEDFEIFYRTAAWARQNVNEGCFVYALTLAILHRNDTKDITLPALYEIYPWYFVHGDILEKADHIVPTSNNEGEYSGRIVNGTAIFNVDRTASTLYSNNEEVALAYFTEDIGLNMFYYYQQMMHPYWLNTNDKNSKFGEYWYYFNQQMLARYYLERLSNGMGEIPDFSWDATIGTGYNPALIYPGGEMFPSRKDDYTIDATRNSENLMFVKTFEQTLVQLLNSSDFLEMNDGMNKALENIVASLFMPELLSSKFQGKNYDAVARHLLGSSPSLEEHKESGFASMEHHETSLRDPMFWQLQKHIMNFLFSYKKLLPRYTETELNFPGVRITNVDMTKLYTQYEYYKIDLNNVFPKTYVETTIEGEEILKPLDIEVAQARLNHKPFMVSINVNSDRAAESLVKIFIGPKVDGNGRLIDLDANKYNFVELDSFLYTLNPGDNIIVRKSEDFKNIAGDSMRTSEMFDKVENALLGLDIFRMSKNETFTGFPSRLLIPKGTKTGLILQMFVIVSPLMRQGDVYNYVNPTESSYYENGISLGYPFDRRIDTSDFYQLNMFMKDVVITNKGEEKKKSGAGKPAMKPYGKDAVYGSEMLRQGGKPYDYTGRKGFDYMAKKTARENIDHSTKASDISNIEVEAGNINDGNVMSENMRMYGITGKDAPDNEDSTKPPSILENKAIHGIVSEVNSDIDSSLEGKVLLRSSGKYDNPRNMFDYVPKRDAKNKLENEYKKKIDIKDDQIEDNSLVTIEMDADTPLSDKMVIDITIPNPTDVLDTANTQEINSYEIDADEKVLPIMDVHMFKIIHDRNRKDRALLKSSGKYDYSEDKFDYSSKKKERKEVEHARKQAIKIIIKSNKQKERIMNEDVDNVDITSTKDSTKDNMFEESDYETTEMNQALESGMDMNNFKTNPHQDGGLGSHENIALLRSSGKYNVIGNKFDYASKKKEREEMERARKRDMDSKPAMGMNDVRRIPANENYEIDNHQILNHGLLKSTGKTQTYYANSKDYIKQQEKELKKAMKVERKMAAAEAKKQSEELTQKFVDQENAVISSYDASNDAANGISPENSYAIHDFEGYSMEDEVIYGNPEVAYHEFEHKIDHADGLSFKARKSDKYIFYDSVIPVYE